MIFKRALNAPAESICAFINNVHAIFALARRIDCLFSKLAHIVNAVIACSVNLHHVERCALIDIAACLALHTGIAVNGMFAVYRHGKNFCEVVLPVPRDPVKRYACAVLPVMISFFSVVVICG